MTIAMAEPPEGHGSVVLRREMTAEESRQYAADLAKSSLLAPYFQNNPANVLYGMELGRSYGLEPVAVLANVHVFDDGQGRAKAALSADFMVSLARREGHVVHVEYDAKSKKAVGTLIRRELLEMDPERLKILKELGVDLAAAYTFREVWTEQKAIDAGLMNKSNWKKYFGDMMKARVKAAIVRAGASEVLIQLANNSALAGSLVIKGQQVGLTTTHTADELGAEVTDEGEFTVERADQPRFKRASRQAPTKESYTGPGGDMLDKVKSFVENKTAAEVADWAKSIATGEGEDAEKLKQLGMIHIACKQLDRLSAPMGAEDGSPTTLGSVLMGHVNPLRTAK